MTPLIETPAGAGGGRCCLCQRGYAPGWRVYAVAELVFCALCVRQRRADVDERVAAATEAIRADEAPPAIANPAPAAPATSFAIEMQRAVKGKEGRAGRAPRRGGR